MALLMKNKELGNYIKSINVEINGGLGNQILQFLAGNFIKDSFGCRTIKFKHINKENYFPSIKKLIKSSDIIKNEKYINSNFLSNLLIKLNNKYKIINNNLDEFIQYKFNKIILSRNVYLNESNSFTNTNNKLDFSIKKSKNLIRFNQKKNLKIHVKGFWQDPTPYLNKLNKLSKEFRKKVYQYENELNLYPGSYIAVHARRGDYISNIENAIEYYSNYSLLNFISSSINVLPSEYDLLPIVIITNDFDWFQKINIKGISKLKREFIIVRGDEILHWNILNNARLNIISNSTFSFSAALLNEYSIDSKLRIIMPFWYNNKTSTLEKGWLNVKGAISI